LQDWLQEDLQHLFCCLAFFESTFPQKMFIQIIIGGVRAHAHQGRCARSTGPFHIKDILLDAHLAFDSDSLSLFFPLSLTFSPHSLSFSLSFLSILFLSLFLLQSQLSSLYFCLSLILSLCVTLSPSQTHSLYLVPFCCSNFDLTKN